VPAAIADSTARPVVSNRRATPGTVARSHAMSHHVPSLEAETWNPFASKSSDGNDRPGLGVDGSALSSSTAAVGLSTVVSTKPRPTSSPSRSFASTLMPGTPIAPEPTR
jgi:hypothetical protein